MAQPTKTRIKPRPQKPLVVDPPRSFPTMDALVGNALDFLGDATRNLEAHPKQSVIAFYAGVELFLKARLMHEHWSLVVAKDNADREKFVTGDFVSVSFEDACKRLDRIVGSPLSKPTFEVFDKVRKHRNKMVHFYHMGATDTGLEDIAIEQLAAWIALRELIQTQWRDAFRNSSLDLTALNDQFSRHRHYYRAGWERVREQLAIMKAEGKTIEECYNCEFQSSHIQHKPNDKIESICFVCNSNREWLAAPCPSCGSLLEIAGEQVLCHDCFKMFTARQLAAYLDDNHTPDDAERIDPGSCSACEGYHTVIARKGGYVCLACLEEFDRLEQCERCTEFNTADMGSSIVKGCAVCAR